MKKIFALVLAAAAIVAAPVASFSQTDAEGLDPPVATSAGRVSLWATAQWSWQWTQDDPGRGASGVDSFETRRVHFGAKGALYENIEYAFTLSLNNDEPPFADDPNMAAGVYEARIDAILSPSWRLSMGSYLPPWTIAMPRPVHSLHFIRYPLIVDSGQWLFTPWRQTMAMISATPGDKFFLHVGLASGLDTAGSFADDNNMKDTMVVFGVEYFPGVRAAFGHWGGRTELRSITLAPGQSAVLPFGLSTTNDTAANLKAGGGVIEHVSTWAALEIDKTGFYAGGEALWNSADKDGSGLVDTFGYQVFLTYSREGIEGLVRYEYFDPDSSGNGEDDEMEWTTLGLNYELNARCKVMANYIFKTERRDNQRANEEFLVQVSLSSF